MRYMAVAETDIGNTKNVNQDSLLVKHALCEDKELLLAAVCDGVGGLSEGELASSTVVRELDRWFEEQLAAEIANPDMDIIGEQLALLLRNLNVRIRKYGEQNNERLGTTITGVLFVNDRYVAVHVGDTRLYYLAEEVQQLTSDQTVLAREVTSGRMSAEEAAKDKRRHTLLQSVGASKRIKPQIISGKAKEGFYVLCSDGFWQKAEEAGVYKEFCSSDINSKKDMHETCRRQIEICKSMGETDNISVIAIYCLPFQENEGADEENMSVSGVPLYRKVIAKGLNFSEKFFRKHGGKKNRPLFMIEEIKYTWTEDKIEDDFQTFF